MRTGEVDVPVDEAGEDQAALDVGDRDAGVPLRDLSVVAEVGDDAVLDDHQPIEDEPGGLLLVPDVLPGIVHEIEKRPAYRRRFARHRCDSVRSGIGSSYASTRPPYRTIRGAFPSSSFS